MHLVTCKPMKEIRRNESSLVGWLLDCLQAMRAGQVRAPKRQMRVVETLALGGRKQLVPPRTPSCASWSAPGRSRCRRSFACGPKLRPPHGFVRSAPDA